MKFVLEGISLLDKVVFKGLTV